MKKGFWYTPKYRPVGIGTVPGGFVASEWGYCNHNGCEFGAVAYQKELTPEQVDDYELVLIPALRELYDYEK